jgi:hypothetical protein
MHNTNQQRLCAVWLAVRNIVIVCWDVATPLRQNPTNTGNAPAPGQNESEALRVIVEDGDVKCYRCSLLPAARCIFRAVSPRHAVRDGGAAVLRKARVRAAEALGWIAGKCHLFVHFEPGSWIRVLSALWLQFFIDVLLRLMMPELYQILLLRCHLLSEW